MASNTLYESVCIVRLREKMQGYILKPLQLHDLLLSSAYVICGDVVEHYDDSAGVLVGGVRRSPKASWQMALLHRLWHLVWPTNTK